MQLAGGFPDGTSGKEPSANAGDLRDTGAIPGLGRSPGGGRGKALGIFAWRIAWTEEPGGRKSMELCYLQTHEASLVAQLVKNLPAMQETWVQSLGSEDPLEKGQATHSNILAWRIPWIV